ncbi:TIR domain-containing protein [Methanococcoides burtonii]|uniref:TIR domain-containing protein n=1 Tax=Methanococcoides burtonii (strain DSM 6242 / NBRC 107633 / OCM 468 / ACE-M) TaxID=259564 RepID=Q12US3_METBU|nr:toll/interleukin-1 receptor domain-containing protein [Methanococcoides burtonii]ABE52803.1 Hypothetical protein Mbur_1921 [Methanococcoides burtonii DSM 6242]
MGTTNKLNVFISYSHQDEHHINLFKTHISPLKTNDLIEEWYDREIVPGEDFQNQIDCNLDNADIICLFISAHFLASKSCMAEKKKAMELKDNNGISVVPIILSPCGWLDDSDILKPLAIPTDGMPVSTFQDSNNAWQNVYTGLKKVVDKKRIVKQLVVKKEFESWIQDVAILTKAHSQKTNIILDDIFVWPELEKFDSFNDYEKTVSSGYLLDNFLGFSKIVLAGEDQSGKTTICKKIFSDLRSKNYVPVYVSEDKISSLGKTSNKISKSFSEQYQDAHIDEIDKNKIIPIIDNFHHAINKQKHIENLSEYSHCIIVVDDIFGLNIKDETLISSFMNFRIRELKPSLRYELVKKWLCLSDNNLDDDYKNIDSSTELINNTLGKNIGKGIMPAYPFFILSTIVTYEAFSMSLDQEITSQGHCYQAFIVYYLMKHDVKNDEINIYTNFLTELAFYIYDRKKKELSPDEFAEFMELYSETYNLPINEDSLLANLTEVVSADVLNNYSFRYQYFYYFFVAKYLSDNMENSKVIDEITNIIDNLHVDENAYIAIFLTHHSKNSTIFKKIEMVASSLFDKYKPARLTKNEMKFFDKQENIIFEQVFPSGNTRPEKERAEILNQQDELEQYQENNLQEEDVNNNSSDVDLRRALKTVEVVGCIIRNHSGSLKKADLENLLCVGMNVHLRLLSNLFELINNETEQEKMVDFIVERLNQLEDDLGPYKMLTSNEKRDYAHTIFWNLNFFIVCGIIHKIVHSLGSDKVTQIVTNVCDEINTPASSLIKHGVMMVYNKNLQIDEFSKGIRDDDFSKVAKKAIKLMVANHCSVHKIGARERQRIQSKFEIQSINLLPEVVHNQ